MPFQCSGCDEKFAKRTTFDTHRIEFPTGRFQDGGKGPESDDDEEEEEQNGGGVEE